jgi:glycosyltransferase involved in cell wall biosynthesis
MLAIRVVEQLLDHHPKVSLLMIGPDKDGSLAHCKRYAQENGLPVSFTGRLSREEWTETSKDCSLLLNTTNFDNMPVSVIEAMALGLPIVSTNVGGMPYLVRDGVDGILLPPNDEKAMARAIQDLLADPERARKMAENARKKVERFDWREVAEQWRELLGE